MPSSAVRPRTLHAFPTRRSSDLVARSAFADMAQADAMARDNAKAIAEAALSRLKNWDISADQLARLQRNGTAARTLTLSAPISGIRSEEHTSELQSPMYLVCRLLPSARELSTLSLHDALPISSRVRRLPTWRRPTPWRATMPRQLPRRRYRVSRIGISRPTSWRGYSAMALPRAR